MHPKNQHSICNKKGLKTGPRKLVIFVRCCLWESVDGWCHDSCSCSLASFFIVGIFMLTIDHGEDEPKG